MAIERKFIKDAVNRLLIREYIHRETERAGFGGIDIQRTPMGTRVSILAERPGMIIGRKGATINQLTDELRKRFKVENPQIEVVEAGRDSSLNAQIMAIKLAEALERGWHFRRAGHSTVQRIMASGALGCQVVIAGKLTGQRHRTEKFVSGHIKYCGDTLDKVMDVGFAVCKKKLGVMGCTVRIMRPDAVLPDMIKIHDLTPAAAPAPEKLPASAEAAEVPPIPTEVPKKGKEAGAKKPRAPKKKKEEAAPAKATKTVPWAERKILDVEGVGPAFNEKLAAVGVTAMDQLVHADAVELSQKTSIPEALIQAWQGMADLDRLDTINNQYAELLVRAGITRVAQLAEATAEAVVEKCAAYLSSVERAPTVQPVNATMATEWIQEARKFLRERAPAVAPHGLPPDGGSV